jgi:hypothetical protein
VLRNLEKNPKLVPQMLAKKFRLKKAPPREPWSIDAPRRLKADDVLKPRASARKLFESSEVQFRIRVSS